MLIKPTVSNARANRGVHSLIVSKHCWGMVCGGMLHAESPAMPSLGYKCDIHLLGAADMIAGLRALVEARTG